MRTFGTPKRKRMSVVAALALIAAGAGVLGVGRAGPARGGRGLRRLPLGRLDRADPRSGSASCWRRCASPRSRPDDRRRAAPATSGFTPAISSLCIPALNLEDGPAGVADGMTSVTQLPAPVDAAATWDTAAEQTYGQVIGAEEAAKGTTVDLGPTINIVRDPRWGRAFESIGEDPYLNGALGAAEIRGVQSTGVMAQVKHLAVYNQETNRNTPSDNAIIAPAHAAGDLPARVPGRRSSRAPPRR